MTAATLDTARPGAAQTWFDGAFTRLHPLLQQLHRTGGTLDGVIGIRTGRGIAGILGRRLAARLGVPLPRAPQGAGAVQPGVDPAR